MTTVNGSMAGTPLADITYVVAMSKVMINLRGQLAEQGLVARYVDPLDGTVKDVNEVGYIDDSAGAVFSPFEVAGKNTQHRNICAG